MDAITFAEAGKLLVEAIKNDTTGFVARVNVLPGQAAAAEAAAVLRRTLARRHSTKSRLNYEQAAAVGADVREHANLAADRRAMLSELLVADVLDAAKAPGLQVQPLVAHKPQPGLDVRVLGKAYDVKAAGQMSLRWSHQGARGRFVDDRSININNGCHEAYMSDAAFAGYICVYVYMAGEQPVAADIFIFSSDALGDLNDGTITSDFVEDMRYYQIVLPLPDKRNSIDYAERRNALLAAYEAAHVVEVAA